MVVALELSDEFSAWRNTHGADGAQRSRAVREWQYASTEGQVAELMRPTYSRMIFGLLPAASTMLGWPVTYDAARPWFDGPAAGNPPSSQSLRQRRIGMRQAARIAIVGGGIGALAAARALRLHGFELIVYEAAPS
jgi:hypothetical protein